MICYLWNFSRCLYEKTVFLKNTYAFFGIYCFFTRIVFLVRQELVSLVRLFNLMSETLSLTVNKKESGVTLEIIQY